MPRNKYPEETVKKILDVSLRLFLEKGFEKTTVLDIVSNLGGLTRGAFYHHFKSKEEVLEAIFDESFADNNPFEMAQQAKDKTGLERVQMALKLELRSNLEQERRIKVARLAISLAHNPRFMAEQIRGNQETAAFLTPMIEDGMADGSIRPGNAKVLTELFMLLANFWMLPSYFPCGKEETFEKAAIVKQTFDGLGCPIVDDELEEIFTRVLTAMEWKA
jgi:AcrR family transcriptional regulator